MTVSKYYISLPKVPLDFEVLDEQPAVPIGKSDTELMTSDWRLNSYVQHFNKLCETARKVGETCQT